MIKKVIILAGIVIGAVAIGSFATKHFISIKRDGSSISIIGGADGPTSIFMAGELSEGE